MIVTITDIQNAIYKAQNMVYAIALNLAECYEQGNQLPDEKYALVEQLESYIGTLGRVELDENDCIDSDQIWDIISWINGHQVLAELCLTIPAQFSNPGQPIPVPDGGCCGVETVTGPQVDNTDPKNPVVGVYGDGVTITGAGTQADPFVAVGGGGGSGTVNVGTQYRLAYYAANGNAVSQANAITALRALKSDANGVPTHFDTATEPSLTELTYVKGVTSAIQTQLNAKAPIASPTFTGVATAPTVNVSGLTASELVATDGSKNLQSLAVATYPSLAELAFVKGVTSAVQTQFAGKQGILVEITGNITAANDTNYILTESATITDPTPAQAKGYTIFVRNGTATVGGTAYTIQGTLIYRFYHSGAWVTNTFHHDFMPISCTAAAVNLSDSTNYYFSDTPTLPPGATATSRKMKLPVPSVLVQARIETIVGGTLAAGDESATVSLRLNNTTDNTISSAVKYTTAAQTLMITGLNVAVGTADDFQMKLVTPAYSTNPTTTYISVTLFFQQV